MSSRFEFVNEEYIDSLNVDQLREQLKIEINRLNALRRAFKRLPIVPCHIALRGLAEFADFKRDHDLGKKMQREHGLDAVPAKSELEDGAGLWARIRPALAEAEGS